MKQPQKPSEPPEEDNQELDFEQEILEVERSLAALKERYQQVQRDLRQQKQLQYKLYKLTQDKKPTPEIEAELRQIQQQLEVLEVCLESQLFSWHSFKEPFWQAIRFGGLGVIIGWILKSCAG
jgi:chromosome segregation ATPase